MERLLIDRPAIARSTALHTIAHALRVMLGNTPIPVARAMAALNVLLEGIYSSPWQEVAWVFSRLTGDGFPIEFTFSSADEEIRYAIEVAGPEMNEAQRLSHAERLLQRLGVSLPKQVSTLLHRVQEDGSLLYGAWIGGRHNQDGDRYKLYVEVPTAGSEEGKRLIHTLLGEDPLLPNRVVQLRMIGYDLNSSRTELYFRTKGLETWEIGLLLRRVGLFSRELDLIDLLEEANGRPVQPTLLGASYGFSFSIPPDGEPPIFSLFTAARTIFGGDGRIRRRLLALGKQRNWQFRNYAQMSEPLSDRSDWRTNHGMVSFVVPPQGPLVLHIGLRPPELGARG
jgi:hypothetical protein